MNTRKTFAFFLFVFVPIIFMSVACAYENGIDSIIGGGSNQYMNVTLPTAVADNPQGKSTKFGISKSIGLLGLIAFGDASIYAAKEAGSIKTINNVENEEKSYFGIVNIGKTVVYGN